MNSDLEVSPGQKEEILFIYLTYKTLLHNSVLITH